MKNQFFYLLYFIALLFFSCEREEITQTYVPDASISTDQNISLLANQVGADGTGAYYSGTRDITSRHAGVTFTNATFADGARIFNTRNVIFRNCTFGNRLGWAVEFREELYDDDTYGVQFIDCKFVFSKYDNVIINRDDGAEADSVLHTGVQFSGCAFEGWANAQLESNKTFYHAIYAKCPNVTIDHCDFNSTVSGAGHAVSLRSSARVTNNVFRHSAVGENPISYTPKNLPGTPEMGWDNVKIWNNLIYSGNQGVANGRIYLQPQEKEATNPNNLVEFISIAFNTIAILPGGESEGKVANGLQVKPGVETSYIAAYGNLIVDGRANRASGSQFINDEPDFDYISNNVVSTNLDEYFVDWANGDFHLKAGSDAIGAADEETNYMVPTDIAGQARSKGDADAGAYMYTGVASSENTITIRAKGDCGSETMELRVDGELVETWKNVSTSFTDYIYNGFGSSREISVHFTNDATGGDCADRNLIVDYISVCSTTYQTETVATKTSGCCASGKSTLYTNGDFNYGVLTCSAT